MARQSLTPQIERMRKKSLTAQATRPLLIACGIVTVLLTGCSSQPSGSAPAPARTGESGREQTGVSKLPPITAIRGAPLGITVRYPADNQVLTSSDSNFVLGSVGSGDARLIINGVPATVAPNGAFLAWLAVPRAPDARYELIATRGSETAKLTVRVRLPASATPLMATGQLRVDSGSITPGRGWWMRPDDIVRVSIRAPLNARVTITGRDSVQRPLVAGLGDDSATVPERGDAGALFATEIAASLLADSAHPARLTVVRGTGRTRERISLPVPPVRMLSPTSRVVAKLLSTNPVGSDTDRVVNARTVVGGTYKWLLLPGTILEVSGRQQGFTRVRLDANLDAWVASSDLTLLPSGAALPRRVTGGLRVTPDSGWVDLSMGMSARPAHLIEAGGRTIRLTLYGVQANPEISPILGNDTLIRRIAWEQVTNERVSITLTLSQPVYGWLTIWDENKHALVLRIRRVPPIDLRNPLRGITIAVDPGHPPAGATGPTGLYEGDAVLPVAMKLVEMLKAQGADAFSTRGTLAPLGLSERTVAARRANAHVFVSVHMNALPDGVNPFASNGTSTLFFHNASEPLARFTQQELVRRFGLRDLGVHYQNLAVARPSWYPSVLAEGLFVIIPEQEAAMRNEDFQRDYAVALLVGLERYLRWLGEGGQ